MKLQHFLTTAVVTLSLAAGAALAQGDKAAKQAEVRKAAEAALEKFYKADPKIRARSRAGTRATRCSRPTG